jgi:Asp-tRNA(Asn)/Glu-tRNA(Gln) amidotransferase A subunit family amidase
LDVLAEQKNWNQVRLLVLDGAYLVGTALPVFRLKTLYRDGTTHIVLEAGLHCQARRARTAAAGALDRFRGVFAAHSALRAAITLAGRGTLAKQRVAAQRPPPPARATFAPRARSSSMSFTRRDFIGGGTGACVLGDFSSPLATAADSYRMVTLSEWLRADRDARRRGLNDCLQRIQDLEPSIHAWVQVHLESSTADGPLADIPFGVKDIVETKGLATEYGSAAYEGRVGTEDAAIITQLRGRGAILLGKTVTSAFAYRTPGPTRNPRDPAHTPGGSSSGSAAAIAADMVPFTIGEQTRGSIIRPASFCGVTGFKPTHDLLPMEGVLVMSRSLDTLGFFTHTPDDMLALWAALGYPAGRDERLTYGVPEPAPDSDPEMANAFRQSVASLRRAGVDLRSIDIVDMLKRLDRANITLENYEGARAHEARVKEFGDRLDQALLGLVRDGLQIPDSEYDAARRYIAECRTKMAVIFRSTPVILTPAAVGQAPLGLSTTGDPRMNAPWTALGTPAVSIPMPVAGGLPLGLQLTADVGQDARLLRAAVQLQKQLDAGPKVARV